MPPPSAGGLSSAPLADYFWIAGVDGMEILDVFQRLGDEYRASQAISTTNSNPAPTLADTIEEDADAEDQEREKIPFDGARLDATPNSSKRTSAQHLPRSSLNYQRLSFLSGDSDLTVSHSNRSSTTIKRTPSPRSSTMFSDDFDFDKALVKFASEREHFLTDLSLSAGAITNQTNPRPKSKYRAQKIVPDEPPSQPSSNLLRSSIGSVRRHMSFRDMNSMKRPSLARQGK